jgi:hypothetical protein
MVIRIRVMGRMQTDLIGWHPVKSVVFTIFRVVVLLYQWDYRKQRSLHIAPVRQY